MNERLKQVRKCLKLSQGFEAPKLGMIRTTIVAIETVNIVEIERNNGGM